ncbi:MAG: hypothetical protein KDE15_15925 [Erythrobacter sp.]|nr:hypothetical protein [Erythrobacter sp.]
MEKTIRSAGWLALALVQRLAVLVLCLATLALIGWDIACALGHGAWIDLPLAYGGAPLPQAGMIAQLGLTALLGLLCAYLPANFRVMALENSHRRFHIGMGDVARAYVQAHASDRGGAFLLKGEFDSIRERIAFLRDHPDLAELQADTIEVAAQMSHVSRELARIYSDGNVMRARDFLIARQQEIEDFNIRLAEARAIAVEIRHWTDAVEIEEAVARSQLARLTEELLTLVPELAAEVGAGAPEDAAPAAAALPDEEPPWSGDDRIVALLSARATRG